MLVQDIVSIMTLAGVLVGSIILHRKLLAMQLKADLAMRREIDLVGCVEKLTNQALTQALRPEAVAVLRRPHYRPRWRFSFPTPRTALFWATFVLLVSSSRMRCVSDPRPIPTVERGFNAP